MWRRTPTPQGPAHTPFPWSLAAAVLLLTTAINAGPPALHSALRNGARDLLSPALQVVDSIGVRCRALCLKLVPQAPGPAIPTLSAAETRIRELELETVRLRHELTEARARGNRPRGSATTPLLAPGLIEARWLGPESVSALRTSGIVSAGQLRGVTESALVLAARGPLVDLGRDEGLAAGDPVFAGRIVLGKIAEVGRLTSTLRLVTDPDFVARVRVARRTTAGLEMIAEGTLVGSDPRVGPGRKAPATRRVQPPTAVSGGEPSAATAAAVLPAADSQGGCCWLRHVTEPVAVGDQVYTAEADGVLRSPMYYGEVIAAELAPSSNEWEVQVRPASAGLRPADVEILRLNLVRQPDLAN